MNEIFECIKKAVSREVSDIHLIAGESPVIRINGVLENMESRVLKNDEIKDFIDNISTQKSLEEFMEFGESDFAYVMEGQRFRVNIFHEQGNYAVALRLIMNGVPSIDELGLPKVLKDLCKKKKGLILVTGPTGSGKSTTLAAMINEINKNTSRHIITLEDPIEYVFHKKKSYIRQREIGVDTKSFTNGIRAALRQDPDVILIGEMRDLETISAAVMAAETGHLVLSTLHTIGAAKTIDRIIDVFPPHQQSQIRSQIGMILEGVISQDLIINKNCDGRVGAFEIMTATPAVRNLIREGKTHQLQNVIQTGMKSGMVTMDMYLKRLVSENKITEEISKDYLDDAEFFTLL